MYFLFLFYIFLTNLSFAEPAPSIVYYGVELNKIQELKHQHFQAHDIGWSGIGKDGLTRIYLAPNEGLAQIWIQKMKKRHYKSTFIEVEDHADYTLWDEEKVIISQFGLLMILVQGERIQERRTELQGLFITDVPLPPSVPEIKLTEIGFALKTQPNWQYSFVGGKPVYQSTMIEFTHLPEIIIVWNELAQSHRFQLQKEPKEDGILLFYKYLPDEVPAPQENPKSLK